MLWPPKSLQGMQQTRIMTQQLGGQAGKEQGALQDNLAHKEDRPGELLNPTPLSTGALQPAWGLPLNPRSQRVQLAPKPAWSLRMRSRLAVHPRITRMRTLDAAGTAHPGHAPIPAPSGRGPGGETSCACANSRPAPAILSFLAGKAWALSPLQLVVSGPRSCVPRPGRSP